MTALWFDPRAEIVKHDPPLKPFDPSRPIKRAAVVAKPPVEMPEPIVFDWSNFIGGIYVAGESDPA